ncbi:EH signature domain-containing protein [Aestuariivirga sp.]|jgi:hypothetical protein|uniref:EH signature domain-containing protein n=1 Tax=Aestuariivirga sp. TaxID=2650926 RepID=UPI003784A613
MMESEPKKPRDSARTLLARQKPLTARVLPSLDGIGRSIEKILARWPDIVSSPPERDREALALSMLFRIQNNKWTDITIQRVTSAAIAIFDEDRRRRPDLLPARKFYLGEIAASKPGPFLDGMVEVYIDSFDLEGEHTKLLADALSARRADLGGRLQKLHKILQRLFKPDAAPLDLARMMLEAEDSYAAMISNGLTTPHASGLARAAHKIFLQLLAPELDKAEARTKLFHWLTPENGPVLQSGAGAAVEALLAPWRDHPPPAALRNELSERIIAAWNDPRLHAGGIWSGFDPALRAILLQWLTYQDMKFFCDMVTATQNSHMWPPRRDFWLKLHKDNMIDEAWVAFGSDARRFAQQNLLSSGRTDAVKRFALQPDRGGSTSLLIMRIGNKIVVDGCHSYKTHIFRQDDKRAPKLYERVYHCDNIMRASTNSKSHNPIYNWSQWVLQNV